MGNLKIDNSHLSFTALESSIQPRVEEIHKISKKQKSIKATLNFFWAFACSLIISFQGSLAQGKGATIHIPQRLGKYLIKTVLPSAN